MREEAARMGAISAVQEGAGAADFADGERAVKVGDNVFRGTTYDNNGVIEFDIMKSYRLR